MTSDTAEISVEDRNEKRRLVAAYVQQRLITECAARGGASRIAKSTGFSTAHVANAKNWGTVGPDFAEAMAKYWDMTPDALRATALEWGTATGFRGEVDDSARPLGDVDGWAEGKALALAHKLPLEAIDEAGGFVPPRAVRAIDPSLVVDLVKFWVAVRPIVGAATATASSSLVAVPTDGPAPTKPVAAFPVAGSRAAKKRGRQAT